MKQLGPGVYDDGEGGMHVDVEEFAVAAGIPLDVVAGWTDVEIERMMQGVLRRVYGERWHEVELEITEKPL